MTLSPDMVVPSVARVSCDGKLLTGIAAQGLGHPERTVRGFKRRLGDPTPIVIGGRGFSPAAIMAAQLRDILTDVGRVQGGPPGTVVLTYPAVWGPYRLEQFTEVPRLAGITNYQLLTEPEAAATHYGHERRLGDGEVIAVYDLGGGTFDTTILRMRDGGMEILGTPEGIEHMGGIDFDDTLYAGIDDRLDNAITELDTDDPAHAASLTQIRALTTKAKIDLSIEPEVTVTVPLPTGSRDVVISRLDFNEMIKPSIELTIDALHRTIASARLDPGDISAVLMAGGSSRIPLIPQLVSQELGKPVRVAMHPKHTVALGAARLATQLPARSATGAGAAPGMPTVPAAPRRHKAAIPALPPQPSVTTGTVGGVAHRRRSRWLIPLVAVAVAVTLGITIALVQSLPPGSSREATTTAPSAVPVPNLPLFAGGISSPWIGYVGSAASDWKGAPFGTTGAEDGPVSAKTNGKDSFTVTWSGEGQVYLADTGPHDLTRYFDNDGALVFDVAVHQPPEDTVAIELQCSYPCHSKVEAAGVFRRLPVDQKSTVAIPLRCFAEKRAEKWDPSSIDTPWLVYSEASFTATFSAIRWEQNAGSGPNVTPCNQLN